MKQTSNFFCLYSSNNEALLFEDGEKGYLGKAGDLKFLGSTKELKQLTKIIKFASQKWGETNMDIGIFPF